MNNPTEARVRSENLKRLREAHAETVGRTQALLREQKQIQRQICQALREKPKTVPEVAAAIGRPAHEVLWYLAALKKYGIVAEAGMCDDYPLYQQLRRHEYGNPR
jgi:predicted transcriptional regulator